LRQTAFIEGASAHEVPATNFCTRLMQFKALLSGFINPQSIHVRRNGNRVAHGLAKEALLMQDQELIFLEDIPHCVAHFLSDDIAVISSS